MACTLRISSSKARLGQPEVKLGIIPGAGGTQRLPKLIGMGRAMELILTGEPVNADQALAIGLVNRVVEPDQLMIEVRSLATMLASRPNARPPTTQRKPYSVFVRRVTIPRAGA